MSPLAPKQHLSTTSVYVKTVRNGTEYQLLKIGISNLPITPAQA